MAKCKRRILPLSPTSGLWSTLILASEFEGDAPQTRAFSFEMVPAATNFPAYK